MLLHSFSVILSLLLTILVGTRSTDAAQIRIRKCCPFGQDMRIENRLGAASSSIMESRICVTSDQVTSWIPSIKLLKRNGFFKTQGEAPKHMTFVENSSPPCQEPLTALGPQNVVLVMDGTLVVSERGLLVGNEQFCVDRESALFCPPLQGDDSDIDNNNNNEIIKPDYNNETNAASMIWRRKMTTIRKCCGPRAAYNSNQTTCIDLMGHNPLNSKPVFDQNLLRATKLDLLFGFPTTCSNTHFAILGQFKAEMFDEERNVLKLESGHKELAEDEFCLEHTVSQENETAYSSHVNVFTCAEFFQSTPLGGEDDIRNVSFDDDHRGQSVDRSTRHSARYYLASKSEKCGEM